MWDAALVFLVTQFVLRAMNVDPSRGEEVRGETQALRRTQETATCPPKIPINGNRRGGSLTPR